MHSLAWQACAGVHASMRIIDGMMKVPGNFPGTFPGVLGSRESNCHVNGCTQT